VAARAARVLRLAYVVQPALLWATVHPHPSIPRHGVPVPVCPPLPEPLLVPPGGARCPGRLPDPSFCGDWLRPADISQDRREGRQAVCLFVTWNAYV